MNKKVFLFSNLISISKINCIDLNKIEVFLDNKRVDTEKYIKEDELDDESPVALIDGKEVSISKIEVELQNDDILYFRSIEKIQTYFTKKNLKTIKIYLVSYGNCCKKFSIKIGKKCNSFKNMPYNIIASFYENLSRDINKKETNVDIFDSFNYVEDSLYQYICNNYFGNGYDYNKNFDKNINFLFVNDILIKKEGDSDFKSIIEKNDNNDAIIEKLEKLEKCNVAFIVESKKFDDKNIDVHINFDDITNKDEYKVRESPLETSISSNIRYCNEFYKKKDIKLNEETVAKYEPLFKNLPNQLEFKKEKNKYKKDEFVKKIRNDIENYVKKRYKDIVFDINTFFPTVNIEIYKKNEYLNNNEEKIKIKDEDIIYCDEVFVEFKAEDIIRLYSIYPHIYAKKTEINVTFETTTNENLKNKTLEFQYHDLLSDYLKENIFCRNGFEFVKDINDYKVIYQNKEYNPGEHIDFKPSECKDVIFKILENDDVINKKIKDQEDKKQALIAKIKSDLNNLKSSITNEMTSNDLRNKLNTIINTTTIEDQDCKNLITEINVKINEKVQKELKSTNDVTKKHKIVNDALKDLLNNSKEKNVTDLQTSLKNILANGYNPDEENKKLIDQVKSEINVKKTNNKNEKTDTYTDKNINNDTAKINKTRCCAKYKSDK